MKVMVFNGPKAAYSIFGVFCAFLIFYFGFFRDSGSMEVSGEALEKVYVAVIIDDFGNGTDGTKEFLYMDIPFTGAVMPAMAYTEEESRLLYESGKDVILHMPMEPHKGDQSWLGDLAILAHMGQEQVSSNVSESIKQIQNCIGINNHMGSKIMEDEELLRVIMTHAKENNLFFVDSVTTNKSKAGTVAEELGVQLLKRDVFLDGTKDVKKIEKNFLEAAEIARKRGFAIAIGHVGEEGGRATAQAMKNVKSQYDQQNVEFVTLSQLIELIGAD